MFKYFLYFLILSFIFILNIAYIWAQPIEITISSNPKTVKIDTGFVLNVIIQNTGSEKQELQFLDLLYPPWQNTTDFKPSILQNNQKVFHNVILKVPKNVTEGVYDIVLRIKTKNSQYIGNTTVEVTRITSFSLSGDLPFSIIGMIIPGITSYIIIQYMSNRKIDINIPSILLIAIPFGFTSWFLANIPIDKIDESPPEQYVYAVIISIFLAFLFYVLMIPFINFLTNFSSRIEKYFASELKELKEIGILRSPKSWITLFQHIRSIRKILGQRYTFRIKVTFIDNSANLREVEGVLWSYDSESHDIVLLPRYIARCYSIDQFLESLSVRVEENYKKNKKYRKQLEENFNKKNHCDIVNEIKNELLQANQEEFHNLLKKIDFSIYVYGIVKDLKLSVEKEYGDVLFISGASILSVMIVQFETQFAILLGDVTNRFLYNSKTILKVPRSISTEDFPFR